MVIATISTRGRYDTTLPLAIQSVALQTVKPDRLIIFDDNDQPKDLRQDPTYQYLFQLLNEKGIGWEVIFGERKGQHYNHQKANQMKAEWIWRLDDDCVAEPDVLGKLITVTKIFPKVGAVGGSILTPGQILQVKGSNRIDELYKPNLQWGKLDRTEEVDHLHCSFLYRANTVNYNLELSPVAHREETLFTYKLKLAGYHNYITPCIIWHLKSEGGIRSHTNAWFYEHDENIFQKEMQRWGYFYAVLNSGLGDHLAFKNILPDIKKKFKNITLAVCYPEVFIGEPARIISIAEAHSVGNIDAYNIYKWMVDHNWKTSIIDAYKQMYL